MTRILTVTTLIGLVLFGTSCATAMKAPASAGFAAGSVDAEHGRVVIKSGSLELRAKDLAAVKQEVDTIIREIKGWVENWSIEEDRWLRMTLRVPEAELDATMDRVAMLGKVVSRSLNSQDVTEELIDLEARLKNLRSLRDRLRSYLEQATTLEEILQVEKELTRVQTEIESIEAKLKILKSQIAMSELDLTVRRRGF